MTKGNGNYLLIGLTNLVLATLLAACGGTIGEPEGEACGTSDFTCESGGCVPVAQVCNGRDNCSDGSDEANCIQKCENRSDYRCKDGQTCVSALEVCDGRPDCPGGDDEATCATNDCDGFQCRDGSCIPADKKCNDEADCLLAEDEAPGLCSPTRCGETDYRCNDGRTCVPEDKICDDTPHCPDGDDEAEATCPDKPKDGGTEPDPTDGKGGDDGGGRPGGGNDTPGKGGENNPDEDRPCISIDEKGLCDGTVLSWCDNGQVEKRDCAREGKVCQQLDPEHGYTCVATEDTPPPKNLCDTVSEAGTCNGDLLTFCSRGNARTVDCSRRGQTCVSDGNRMRCGGVTQGGTGDPCNGLTEAGTCDGDILRFCKDGQPGQYDCAASGMACETNAGTSSCVANECGDIDYQGECQGATLRYCADGARLIEIDCQGDYGLDCGFKNDEIGFVCKAPDNGNSCGDLTFEGECDGSTVRWCQDGVPAEIDCGIIDMSCGDYDLDGQQVKACVAPPSSGCGDITYEGECQGDTVVWCATDGTLSTKDCSADDRTCGFISDTVGYWCTEPQATTCEGFCGENLGSDGVCHCDELCTAIGDCCDDYADVCE